MKIVYDIKVHYCSGTNIVTHAIFRLQFWLKALMEKLENISNNVCDTGADEDKVYL